MSSPKGRGRLFVLRLDNMTKHPGPKKRSNVHDAYRHVLEMPHLADAEIIELRHSFIPLVQAICEQVWGQKFY